MIISLVIVTSIFLLFAIVAAFNQPEQKLLESPTAESLFAPLDYSKMWPPFGGFSTGKTLLVSPQYNQYYRWLDREYAKQDIWMAGYTMRVIVSPMLKGDEAYLIDHDELNRKIAEASSRRINQMLFRGDTSKSEDA